MSSETRSYRDLLVWQKAMQLVKAVYLATGALPSDERFGLVAQMRRAAVSIPSNIAEGQARQTTGEFVNSLSHAEGSAAELDTQITLAFELGLIGREPAAVLTASIDEVRRMLNGLRRSLR